MGVIYKRIDGELVSQEQYAALRDARADGVGFRVNEGKRTMARQAELVREKGVWSPSNRTGAAIPSRTAPHIREGRIDHADDIVSPSGATNDSRGGANALARWLRAHGIRVSFPVPGEPWHMEMNASDLKRYFKKHGAKKKNPPLGTLGPKQWFAGARLLYHRRVMNAEARTGKGPKYRKQLGYARRWLNEKGGVVYYRNRASGKQRAILNKIIQAKSGYLD